MLLQEVEAQIHDPGKAGTVRQDPVEVSHAGHDFHLPRFAAALEKAERFVDRDLAVGGAVFGGSAMGGAGVGGAEFHLKFHKPQTRATFFHLRRKSFFFFANRSSSSTNPPRSV